MKLLLNADAFLKSLESCDINSSKEAEKWNGKGIAMSKEDIAELVSFLSETDVSKLEKYSYEQIFSWLEKLTDSSSDFGNFSFTEYAMPMFTIFKSLKKYHTCISTMGKRRVL